MVELLILISVECGVNGAMCKGVMGSVRGGRIWMKRGVGMTTLLNGFGLASDWRSGPAMTISTRADCGNGKILPGGVVDIMSMMPTSLLLVVTKVKLWPHSTGLYWRSVQPNLVTTHDYFCL